MSPPVPHFGGGLRLALLEILPELLREWLPDGEWRGETYYALNPRRRDRNLGSFTIERDTGFWCDRAIGKHGNDPISLFAYLFTGGDRREALKILGLHPRMVAARKRAAAPYVKPAKALKLNAATVAFARRLYAKATDLSGMPAAAYLQSRSLRQTDAWEHLRASVERYPGFGPCPTLYAPITAPDGSLVGLHRTYLTPAGTKLPVPNPRRSLGRVRGNAIRLGTATDQLIICEGLEDGLTLYQQLGGECAVWVAGGTTFLPLLSIPESIRLLTVAADNDLAGKRAARCAAETFAVSGREVRVMRPKPEFKDFNDQLRGIKTEESEND